MGKLVVNKFRFFLSTGIFFLWKIDSFQYSQHMREKKSHKQLFIKDLRKYSKFYKGAVLLRREISLKVICEKVKYSNYEFCNNFCDNEWAYI